MSCGRVETGLGKGRAGGRLLLYKTYRCFLNYVNVFLVKTIKRIIFKKKCPKEARSVRRNLVSVGLFLTMWAWTWALASSVNSKENELHWAVSTSATMSQGFWAAAQLKCLPARCLSFTRTNPPRLPCHQDAHNQPSVPVTRILKQLALIFYYGRAEGGGEGRLSKLL